jgi:acyl carrier protein
MNTTAHRVAVILAKLNGISVDDVNQSDSLIDDLGFDSLESLEAVMAIEDEFEIIIDDYHAENVKTVAELVALVEATVSGNGIP